MNTKIDTTNRLLYNSRIIDTFIKLVKSKYSYVNIGELLSCANMKPYEIADQGHWFTQDQVDRFHERLVKLTNNENIAREAGRYAASPDALGVMRQYALGMVGPANAFGIIRQATANFTRSSAYESKKIASNKIEINVTPLAGASERSYQCENRLGFFEAIAMIYNNKLPRVEHPECMFRGDTTCRYIISWEESLSTVINRVRNISACVLLVVTAASFLKYPLNTLEYLLPIGIISILILSLAAMIIEKKEWKSSLENSRDSVDKLLEQININYNNALMTNEVGQALSTNTNTDDILSSITLIMEKRLDYDRGLIFLANADRSKLELKAGYGYSRELLGLFDKVSFHLDRSDSRGVFVVSFRDQKPFLINDINDVEETLSVRSLVFARKLGTQSFICCPIICEEKSLGVMAVDNVKSKRPLVQSDMSLLMGIASVIGMSIRNAEHIEDRIRQFNSVLQVLAASIDARDSLTAGHSEKVTEYALGICKELGLSWEYSEMIRVASLLHDYGKIGVPDAILKKKGRLTEAEYEIVKTHSSRTREILEQINFEGIYCQVPEIAGSHHERVDGSGYPHGLKRREIPLGAKIIAAADYFEAITAKRHYRDPMKVERAFQLLREEVDKYFDKRIVEALIAYYTKTYLDEKPPSSTDSRRHGARVQFRAEVSVKVNGTVTKGVSEDVSNKGMYICVDKHLTNGAPVEVCIPCASNGVGPIEAKGRVAWVNSKSQPKKPGFPSGFGVEFLEFKDGTEEFFQTLVSYYIPATCPQGNN
jgi:HD-GYP domain-containing protein (c-di-GMP phosphodiesterase class II)